MEFFGNYSSNTTAGMGNQLFFESNPTKTECGIVFFKAFSGGTNGYSFLFSNTVDSTFSDGSVGNANLVCDEWEIEGMFAGISKTADPAVADTLPMTALTFSGKKEKKVAPGELFSTDKIILSPEKGDYIFMKTMFRGSMIPNNEEFLLPVFRLGNDGWISSRHVPIPSMIGCDRKVNKRIVFWGDSITQGIGTATDSYTHWVADLAELMGEENAYWDIGLGYGRAADAGSCGVWAFKAKQADVCVVCFGVNDLMQGYCVDEIKRNLKKAVNFLNKHGVTTVLQTVPPFDYSDELAIKWLEVNDFIRNELSEDVFAVFDVVPVLSADASKPQRSRYGGHPNAEGCAEWAKALRPTVDAAIQSQKNHEL